MAHPDPRAIRRENPVRHRRREKFRLTGQLVALFVLPPVLAVVIVLLVSEHAL